MRENNNGKTINKNQNGLRQRIFEKDFAGIENNVKSNNVSHPRKSPPTQLQKIGSALFYAVCSICIVFVNKSVLTIYHFPSAQILGNSLSLPGFLGRYRISLDKNTRVFIAVSFEIIFGPFKDLTNGLFGDTRTVQDVARNQGPWSRVGEIRDERWERSN